MLTGIVVAHLRGLFPVGAKHHFTVVAPGGLCRGACGIRQFGDEIRYQFHHLFTQRPIRGDQPAGGIQPMLGLADQITGDDRGIGGIDPR